MITEENVSLMKRAGCYLIQLGIESGSNEILHAMRKGFTIAEALAACEIINRHDISLETFFIVGYPLETEQTLHDTRAAIEKVDCDKVIYSIFTPYPGTQAYAFCQANGLIGQHFESAFYHPHSPANAFCLYIPVDRFRSMAAEIEAGVDAKNKAGHAKRQARYARWFGTRPEPA
jgi:anaerobic magnesium-protoporphyrin IX monomethyl ester cyclase